MPYRQPPDVCPGDPSRLTIEAGTVWYRVHRTEQSPLAFSNVVPSPFRGGRFDSLRADEGHLYAATTECAAIYETLLRDRPFALDGSPRKLEQARIANVSITKLTCVSNIECIQLLDLDDLALIGQEDEWLLTCGSDHYPATRSWGETVRSWCPGTTSICWSPRFGRPARSLIIYGDPSKVTGSPMTSGASEQLAKSPAIDKLRECLRPRGAVI
jgi:hypothetical protein